MALDRPVILGILNITPDSFSDGGRFLDPAAAAARARTLVDEGADILDVGGESTRPGAVRVPPEEQIARVLPVLRAVRAAGIDTPISIDTTRADVARAALDAGAAIINDVSAGAEDPGVLPLAAERACGLILMHRLRPPDADRYSTQYAAAPDYDAQGGVVAAVRAFLSRRLSAAIEAGVDAAHVVLDPGLGFGKSVDQNYALIRATPDLAGLGRPLLSAASRKSFLAGPGDAGPASRLEASIAVSVAHWLAGVRLFRVHDPGSHRRALTAAERLRPAGTPAMPTA
ncbi:MAG: dihydropteroate synthase [Phycisphaerales bacterium]|nr:dihydropteroate synthase [Phycisphaerales bacterium]